MCTVMDPQERTRARTWLTVLRDGRTKGEAAKDVTAVTGWKIDHSRWSRYETGSIPFGRDVLAHFDEYARATGRTTFEDFALPAREPSLEERAVLAAERQADAAMDQTELLRQILAALSPAATTPPFSEDEIEQLREMARSVRPHPVDRPRTSTAQPVVLQIR